MPDPINLAALRALAQRTGGTDGWPAADVIRDHLGVEDPDASYIAALDPDTVLGLLDIAEAARDALRAWQRMPDATLNAGDPRYAWWWNTADDRVRLRAALARLG